MLETIKINKEKIIKIYKPIVSEAHKGTQGHALIIGGSYGKMGSVCLSSKAALKSGCGLVTAFVPKCGYEIVQIAFPEAMVLTDESYKHIENIHFDLLPNSIGIGIGIGLGQEKQTQIALHKFLKSNKLPLVIDADALNILSKNKEWLSLVPSQTILTPHPKELERLIGTKWSNKEDMFDITLKFALKYNCIVVIKGAPTFITDGHVIYQNTTGNAALATAGSGDVLTGIITSLKAQGYESINAAILGVYLHGLAADLALPLTGFESFIASDCISNLGKAFLNINKE